MSERRNPYPTRTLRLVGERQREIGMALLRSAPLDADRPLEFLLREAVKLRKMTQNDLMWAGPLKDIAEQAYIGGRTYTDTVWHEFFKAEYLPEVFDEELTKEGYRKWDSDPAGRRVLVGSTTQLTIKGFAIYLEKVMAYAAKLGVLFSANPNERIAA